MPPIDRAPNWEVWTHATKGVVWEAVALSLNIEPRKVRRPENAWMSHRFAHSEGQEFADRMEVARRNVGQAGPLRIAAMGSDKDYCEIYLAEFAWWAVKVGWQMPVELHALAESSTPAAPTSDANPPKPVEPIPFPQRLTLAWLWEHVPIGWWWVLGGVIFAAFAGGVQLGGSELYLRFVGKQPTEALKTAPPPKSVAPAPK